MAETKLQGAVYLHLFHGRDDPNQEMDDWGFRGPTLGPFRYVQTTYMSDVKFAMEREAFKQTFPDIYQGWLDKGYSNAQGEYDIANDVFWIDGNLTVHDDMLEHQGKFYGDWSVSACPTP